MEPFLSVDSVGRMGKKMETTGIIGVMGIIGYTYVGNIGIMEKENGN